MKKAILLILFTMPLTCQAYMDPKLCEHEALKIAANKNINPPEEKIKKWKEYESLCSKSGTYQRMLADYYISYEKYDEALLLLEKTVNAKKYDTREHKLMLALVYYSLDMPDKTLKIAEDLIKQYPEWFGGYQACGHYYDYHEDWHNAKKCNLKVLGLEPKNENSHLNLAFINYELENLDEVIYHYKKALDLDAVKALLDRRASAAAAATFIFKKDFRFSRDIMDNQKKFDETVEETPLFQQVRQYYEENLAKYESENS